MDLPLNAAPAADPARIAIAGRSLSARQYRWLFPDLAAGLSDDAAALAHFERHGRHEIAASRRVAQEQRLLEVEIQQFSPVAPDAERSPNFTFFPGEGDTLDIFFSYPVPAEAFAPPVWMTASRNARLHLKEPTHCYFQRGVPGVTTSIEETARWLDRVIALVRPRQLRIFGLSAGGYAAIVFGHLLGADAIYAIAPEVVLGKQYYRSRKWFPNPVYHPLYADTTGLIGTLGARLTLIFPAYDPIDYEMIRLCLEQQPAHIGFTATFHPGQNCIDIPRLCDAGTALLPLHDIILQEFDFRYDAAAIATVVRAYEAIEERRHANSLGMLRELHALDPNNHGFLCQIGYHEALLGERERGLATLRRALASILALHVNPETGRATHRLARPLVRAYFPIDRETVASLELLWDQAAGEIGNPV